MEKLHFEIEINAPATKVYNTMLADDTYRQWTAAFAAGSYYRGSWEKGAEILFLAPSENESGMLSRIKENIPNEFVSIEHLGLIKNGERITTGPEVAWAGALENYTFEKQEDGTLLKVDMDSGGDMDAYFNETWPKALVTLKNICED